MVKIQMYFQLPLYSG